jgi:DNA-binding transcriptional LysR family regulator
VLVTDRWVCVTSATNRSVGDELTLDDLARLSWVTQYSRQDPAGMPAMRQLRAMGVEPHIGVLTEGFQAVPFLVAGRDRIAFLHERLARQFERLLPLRVMSSPLELTDVRLAMRWQPALNDDPGHLWFRDVIGRATEHLR